MNTKSSIKQRREQRIKALQMQGMPLMTEEKNTSSMNNSADSKRVRALPMQEPDPEKAWKSNPDRWSDWRDGNDRRDHYSFFKDFRIKMLLSMVLFSALWLLFQFDHKWTLAGQTYVRQAMTEEMDFDAAAAWYKQHFAGAPSFIPIFEQSGGEAVGVDGELRLPVVAPLSDGLVIRTFAELLNGVELAGKGAQEVVAAEEGRVLLAESNGSSASVVIQHANKRITIYGKLSDTSVRVDDWVRAGDPIGHLQDTAPEDSALLYFAVKQDGVFVDPVGVIPLD